MEKKTIGGFIAALRKANGMTQKDLAERLNVSDKTVSRWERDDGAPDLAAIPAIAEIFGVTCDELLRGERKSPTERTEVTEETETTPKAEKQRQRMLKSTLSQYRLLTNSDSVSLKKLINPSLIAMLIGAVVGLNGWHLPNILETVANNGANCMGPISMILAGITISDYDMKELLRNKRSYVIVFFRLILIPLALCFALTPFIDKEILMIVVLLYSMPCGLNTIVFPQMVGEDCRPGASMAMLSTLACLFTIPFCMQVLAWV